MRRLVLFSLLLYGVGAGIFPVDLSAGGGFVLTPYQEGLNVRAPGYQTGAIRTRWADWGVYGFFDAHYVEFEAGYYQAFFGNYEWYDFGYPLDMKVDYKDVNLSYIGLGLSLKYPVELNDIIFTPLFGVSCWINLDADYGYKKSWEALQDTKKTEWDQWWIKLGFDVDFYVTPEVYLRFGAKLDFPLTTDDWKRWGSNLADFFGLVITGVEAEYFGVGGDFSLAVGYKIK
jgi:hypothetical protein